MEYAQQLYMVTLKLARAKSLNEPPRKHQNSKRHFRLCATLKEYCKTISISRNQQSSHIQEKD